MGDRATRSLLAAAYLYSREADSLLYKAIDCGDPRHAVILRDESVRLQGEADRIYADARGTTADWHAMQEWMGGEA